MVTQDTSALGWLLLRALIVVVVVVVVEIKIEVVIVIIGRWSAGRSGRMSACARKLV